MSLATLFVCEASESDTSAALPGSCHRHFEENVGGGGGGGSSSWRWLWHITHITAGSDGPSFLGRSDEDFLLFFSFFSSFLRGGLELLRRRRRSCSNVFLRSTRCCPKHVTGFFHNVSRLVTLSIAFFPMESWPWSREHTCTSSCGITSFVLESPVN